MSSDTGYKLIAGFRLLDSLGVEVNYLDFGSASLPIEPSCAPGRRATVVIVGRQGGNGIQRVCGGFPAFPDA